MVRWEADTPGRLRHAALELYAERGFEHVTVAEIAQRAGLTERTYFRHFVDKREVLFAGSEALRTRLARAVSETPASTGPLAAVTAGLIAFAAFLHDQPDLQLRQRVIAANPELRERELRKLDDLAADLADALTGRGVPTATARLTAETGLAAFRSALAGWLAGPMEDDLVDRVHDAVAALVDVVGSPPPT